LFSSKLSVIGDQNLLIFTSRIQHDVVSGLKYLHVVKRSGIKGTSLPTRVVLTIFFTVDKMEEMVGSYGPSAGKDIG
jgi:hypothetical protein